MKVKKEIKEIAPSLQNYVKKNGFIIPDRYFEKFQEKVCNKLGMDLKEEKDFEVPKHYFENLPGIVIGRISDQKIDKGAKVVQLGFIKKFTSIAAVILILIFAGHYAFQVTPDSGDDEISNEMLIVLIEEYFEDLKLNNMLDQDVLKEEWFYTEMEIHDDEWVTYMDSEFFDENDILMIDY